MMAGKRSFLKIHKLIQKDDELLTIHLMLIVHNKELYCSH